MSNSINNLKQEKYQEGAEIIFKNAKDLFESANLIAEKNKFGIAISLLILSLEELSKAAVIKLKALNNNIAIDNLDKFFNCHTTKHNTLSDFTTVLMNLNKEENKKLTNEETLGMIALIIILALSIKNLNEEQLNYNQVREKGLYVSFDKKSGSWVSPQNSFKKEVFNLYNFFTEHSFEVFYQWVYLNKISNKDLRKIITELRDNIKNHQNLNKILKV